MEEAVYAHPLVVDPCASTIPQCTHMYTGYGAYACQSKFDVRLANETKPHYTIVHKPAYHFIGEGGGWGRVIYECSSVKSHSDVEIPQTS